MCEICSNLIINTSERRHWRRYDAFHVNLEFILPIAHCCDASIFNFDKGRLGQ